MNFPRIGSSATPPHPSGDFKWKDYCPTVFKRLRDVFNINPAQYMLSICGASSKLLMSDNQTSCTCTMRVQPLPTIHATGPQLACTAV